MALRKFRALGDFETNGLMLTPKGQDEANRIWMARFINVSNLGWPMSRETGQPIKYTSLIDFQNRLDEMEAVEFYDEEMLEIYGDKIRRTASKGTKVLPMGMIPTYLDRCDMLLGHNFIQYDVQVVLDVLGYDWYKGNFELDDERRIIDTLVMSRTQHVDRPAIKGVKGPHGLAAWGERIGMPKPEHEEWRVFSMDMVKRLRDDVSINVMTYRELIEENQDDKMTMGINWKEALNIEHRASTIIARAERFGHGFDKEHALRCVEKWDAELKVVDDELYPQLPLRYKDPSSTKMGNADYVQFMEERLSQPLIDLGHFIDEIKMVEDEYGDLKPKLDKEGAPVMEKKAYWPKEWDFDNDEVKHGNPTLQPYTESMELNHNTSKYFYNSWSTGNKVMSAREQFDLMMPESKSNIFPEKILKGWLKGVDKLIAKDGEFLLHPEAFIDWLLLNGSLDNLKDGKDAKASKEAGELRTSVPKWLLKEEVVGPYTSIREPLSDTIVGPYSKVGFQQYELTSNQQVKDLLLKHYDWIPDEFTEKGNPKLTETSFVNMKSDIGGKVQKRFVTAARRTTIKNFKDDTKGWVNLLRDDGKITCRNTPQGTPTARSRHAGVVNVASVDAVKGKEMRRCFVAPLDDRVEPWSYEMDFGTAELRDEYMELEADLMVKQEAWEVESDELDKKGNKKVSYHVKNYVEGRMCQIGCDFAGLELRILAHLMGCAETTYEIVDGDFHTVLWKLIDHYIATRGDTKTVEYAMIFGAGDCKLGSVATLNRDDVLEDDLEIEGWMRLQGGWRLSHWRPDKPSITFIEAQNTVIGGRIRDLIMSGLKPLGDCIERLTEEAEKGYLTAIDGRMLPIRGSHAALNMACQSGGAIVAKKGFEMVAINMEKFRKEIPDFFGELVITYHDEVQVHCNPKYAELVGEMCREAFIKAGEFYNLECPMDGDWKVGTGWLSCH